MASESVTVKRLELDESQVDAIREMLLVGLASYGEVMSVRNFWELRKLESREVIDDAIPLDPTGDAGTVSDFADALRMLRL